MDRAGTYLGLARKAGRLALGEDSSTSAIADGKAKLVLTAADASPGAVRRITAALQGHRAPLLSLAWSRTELGQRLGRPGCAVVCFTDLPLAERFAAAMAETDPAWRETADHLAGRLEKARRRKAAPKKHDHSGK